MRRWLRPIVPRPIRLLIALLRRAFADALAGHRFASRRAPSSEAFPHSLDAYLLPLLIYPGQESAADIKRQNSRLLAASLDGTIVESGEVWSLWRFAGAPSGARGYGEAAAIVNGHLTTAIGGATCLVSTVVFNAGLLAGLEFVERTQHSIDAYGEHRYFELGRDATIEYGYLDLRFRNEDAYPLRLSVTVEDDEVRATFQSPVACPFTVTLEVAVDRSDPIAIRTRTRRTTLGPLLPTRTWVGESRYRMPTTACEVTAVTTPLGSG